MMATRKGPHEPCIIDGCEKPGNGGRDWCSMHWKRWRTTGDPLVIKPHFSRPIEDRLWARLVESDGCWLWPGAANAEGYGRIWFNDRLDYTHRVAYKLMVGEIPDGLDLDHRCRRTACCNPAHLEPVTRAVNLARAREAS